jgi:FlaA1/EpsC-like NDP-sugar epimerase
MNPRVSKNFFIILISDAFLVVFSLYLAHFLRFDFSIPAYVMEELVRVTPFVLGLKLLVFYFFDLYRGMWRYTSLADLNSIVKAASVATVCIIVFILYMTRFQDMSRAVFLMDWCFTIIFITGLRLGTRLAFEKTGNGQGLFSAIYGMVKRKNQAGVPVLIIGAGNCGEKIFREIRSNATVPYQVIGFLDDDQRKLGRKIHGVQVLATVETLEKVVDITGAKEIIIAIPTASAERMRQIIMLCKECGVDFKTVPSMGELINGRVTVSSLRNVEYRDLLGREQVMLDREKIGNYLGNKIVLITGAAGSIGKGLCHQIGGYGPGTIILFEKAESPLYELDLELKHEFPDTRIVPVLGDVSHYCDLEALFHAFSPEIVFHAAAYKHVPMLENHPWKAIETNVVGTENVICAALKYHCKRFVFVSTDKAVNPTNVMGASKRVAEFIVQQACRKKNADTRFIIVRFGNVIGSAGSVIPLFKRQIKQGGPVTVTHPEMTRYFMLIPEACQLILQAGAMGEGGEIFVLEMGKPIKIDSMARDLIRFSGYEPDIDIPVVYTGLRPGEKLFEELMTSDERVVPTEHHKILVFRGGDEVGTDFMCHLDQLKKTINCLSESGHIINILKTLVPEYHPQAQGAEVNEHTDHLAGIR